MSKTMMTTRLTIALLVVFTLQLVVAQDQQAAEPVPIISYKDDANPDGTYEFGYEAGNGIKVDAKGDGAQQSGSVKYIDTDGNPVEWTYTADVNGYQPQGSIVPAIPEHIVRALQYIREHSTPSPPLAEAAAAESDS